LPKRRPRHPKAPAAPTPRRLRLYLWLAAGLVVCVALGVGTVTWRAGLARIIGGQRPLNVLLITLDTTRADYLGCYGAAAAQTPTLDRLAREGTLFRHCSTCTMMTLPSHCSIMTGLYPFVHGVRRNGMDHLPAAASTLAEVLKAAGFATAASIGSYVLDARFGLAQGFDVYHGVPVPSGASVDAASSERKGDKVCDDALALLRERAQQRFFLWVHFYDPHYPYESPRHPDIQSAEAYADEIAYMDGQIGRLLDEVKKLGLQRSTLVLLVGDHGEGLEEHQEYQHGFFAYETCQHVPLLMRCPGVIPGGRQIDAVVRTVDVAPTILELTGQPPLHVVSGVSLAPLLAGRTADLQLRAYAETPEPYTLLRLSTIRTLTSGHWKYIWSTAPQLFDLASDPGERHNVIAQQPDQAAALHDELRALLTGAPPRLRDDRRVALTSDDATRLESLGYVGAGAGSDRAGASGLDTFEVRGADPHAYAGVMRTYERARDAIGHGQFAQAERDLRSVLATLPDAPAPERDLAFALSREGKSGEASQIYERVLAAMPWDARTHVQYATLLMDRRRWEDAAVEAEDALQWAPDDFAAHMILGAAYGNLNRLAEAEAHLEAAAQIQPEVTTPLYALGQLYVKQRRFAEAGACFRKVLALDPQSSLARAALQAIERAGR
jgi:arylsulfatase A-like enzyme/Flp pilus assembly protein TadD